MPQMNPILWLSLFCMFILTFLLVNPLIFFTKNFHSSSTYFKKTFNIIHWKW